MCAGWHCRSSTARPAVNAAASAAAGLLSRRASSRPEAAPTAYRGKADTTSSASRGGSSGSAAARRYSVSRGSCSPATVHRLPLALFSLHSNVGQLTGWVQ